MDRRPLAVDRKPPPSPPPKDSLAEKTDAYNARIREEKKRDYEQALSVILPILEARVRHFHEKALLEAQQANEEFKGFTLVFGDLTETYGHLGPRFFVDVFKQCQAACGFNIIMDIDVGEKSASFKVSKAQFWWRGEPWCVWVHYMEEGVEKWRM